MMAAIYVIVTIQSRSAGSNMFLSLALWGTSPTKEIMDWNHQHDAHDPDAQGTLQCCVPMPGGFSATMKNPSRQVALAWYRQADS